MGSEITGNKITNCDKGISLSSSNENSVKDNFLSSGEFGVFVFGSNDNVFENNTANSNSEDGFYFKGTDVSSKNNLFIGNTAKYNGDYGFSIRGADDTILRDNEVSHNKNGIGVLMQNQGIYSYYPENNQLANNTLLFNTMYAISLSFDKNSRIFGNNVSYNSEKGVYGNSVEDLLFYNNKIEHNPVELDLL